MENLQVQTPPDHGFKIIAVAGEKIEGEISDLKTLTLKDGTVYKIVDRVTCLKNQMIPSCLIIMATGTYIPDSEIWNTYKKSNKLIFFICEKC